jgi:hypothetical protein
LRAALIAGVSAATLLCAGSTGLSATWNSDIWWGTANRISQPNPTPPKSVRRSRPAERPDALDKTPVPTGVLHIIVSIDRQRATLFADGLPVASTAISSGTPGHPTPTGLFTVIQKSRHHVSNLYNASMPYMQRITWSGSALHQGPLPGYPASHGCVRLTESFAQLLWKSTKMGARVIVTRPDVAPHEIEHARLFVPKPKTVEAPPLPVASPLKLAEQPRAVEPAAEIQPQTMAQPLASEPTTTGSLVRTADATNAVAVMAVVGDGSKEVATSVVTEPAVNAPAAEQPTKLAVTEREDSTPPQAAIPAEPVEAKSAEAQPIEAKPAEVTQPVLVETKPVEAKSAEAMPTDKPDAAISIIVEEQPSGKRGEAKPAETKPEEKSDAPKPIVVDERPKVMPSTVVQEADGRPISVFASLKEGKLYVRKGWKPLFEAPVSFEYPEQPIGTHVYTAMGHKIDGSGLRWTVVSIPSSTRRVAELKVPQGRKRHHETAKAVEIETPMPSASAALDRIVLTPDLAERISALITPGSSLIVSDNNLSDETGEYTDFIVLTR